MLRDWIKFVARTDIPVVPHIALAHAHFECLHPFMDGNGRTGRVAVQRQLVLSGYSALPLSTALFAMRDRYEDIFPKYQNGQLEYPVLVFSIAVSVAAHAVLKYAPKRDEIISEWLEATSSENTGIRQMSDALAWISDNPAFAQSSLADSLTLDWDVAGEIIEHASLAGIITDRGIKTGPYKSKNRETIWEANRVYELVGGY